MSGGTACKDKSHKESWFVQDRRCNHSAFSGYNWTSSAYSGVWCPRCYTYWRTKAAYVDTLPDGNIVEELAKIAASETSHG